MTMLNTDRNENLPLRRSKWTWRASTRKLHSGLAF